MYVKTFKLTLILISILFGTQIASAQKCKYELDDNDPMTEERIRRNSIKLKGYFIISFYRKANDLRFEMNARFVGERNFIVAEGTEAKLKLMDNSILTLKSAQDASPVSYVTTDQVMTSYGLSFYCSKEEYQKIAESGIKVINAKLGDQTITFELKKKDIEKTSANASCILTE